MILTHRDQAIFQDLQSYGLHSTRNLAQRHFPHVAMTTILRRLRALERSGYITRITGLDGGGNAWCLSKSSASRLAPQACKIHFPRFILDHDLKLVDLRLRLERAGIAHSWRPEHEIRAKVAEKHGLRRIGERTIPDGLMGVETEGLTETIAVELELSIKNQRRYQRIFRDYGSKKNLWGFWYVVQSQSIGRQLMKAAKDSGHLGQSPYFLWSLLADVMADPLNATVHSYRDSYKLHELWKPEKSESPAHTPAQGVSSSGEKAEPKANELTV